MSAADAPLLEIRMKANRSLSPRGLGAVILVLTVASLLIGTVFWSMGAWPVPGFCGAEVLLAGMLLYRNARSGRATEAIVLRPEALLLHRTDARGQASETRLPPFWLRVELLDRPAAPVRVRLVGHGISEEVGGLLGEDARRDLAQALRAALHRCNTPRFDNPQLRN
jgi:uncharacterized membrane protein